MTREYTIAMRHVANCYIWLLYFTLLYRLLMFAYWTVSKFHVCMLLLISLSFLSELFNAQ